MARSIGRRNPASIWPDPKAFLNERIRGAAVFCSSGGIPKTAVEILR
jgi:hypothetical protein